MGEFDYWLTVIVLLPLLGAAVAAAVPSGVLAKQVAVGTSLLTLAVVIAVAFEFEAGAGAGGGEERYQLAEAYDWIPAFGIQIAWGLTGISLALVAMTAVLAPVCILASWNDADPSVEPGELRGDAVSAQRRAVPEEPDGQGSGGSTAVGLRPRSRRRVQTYMALLLALEGLLLGVFLAKDLFLFYVLFEAMLIPMYFIIGSFGGGQRSYAAVKFLLYSLLGGLLMLAALIGLYVEGRRQLGGELPNGTFDLDTLVGLEMGTATERLLFLGFFIAFAIKAPLWPLHTWLPDAAAEAPAGGAVLMVSVMDKVGTFGMIAICLPLFPEASEWAAPAIVVLAVIGILYGALLAIGQSDIKRLIAYTSVSHFGFIILGIFVFTTQGQSGAALYMVNHGFSTAALFLVAGMLIARRGSRHVADYGGVAKVAPALAGSFLIAGLSSLALPGLSSFVSEFLVLVGTYRRYEWAAVLAGIGIILAALYILLLYQRTMTGPVRPHTEGMRDLVGREVLVVAPLIALIIALGFYPKPLLDIINPTVERTMSDVGIDDPALDTAAEGTEP